jgi:ankyrin repeat protein
MNEQFEVASFLLEHGADVNGAWGLHEPTTILHEAAGNGKLATVRFLVERGANTTIRDERFGATAADWAAHMEHREIEAFLSTGEVNRVTGNDPTST